MTLCQKPVAGKLQKKIKKLLSELIWTFKDTGTCSGCHIMIVWTFGELMHAYVKSSRQSYHL